MFERNHQLEPLATKAGSAEIFPGVFFLKLGKFVGNSQLKPAVSLVGETHSRVDFISPTPQEWVQVKRWVIVA